MWRWLLIVFVTLLLFNGMAPWLRRLGIGRLPGDLHFRWAGRDWNLPIGSTVVLSLLANLLARFL